jgi:integrase
LRGRAETGRARADGERYTTRSYRRAIERACDAAGVPRFSPHQLRHLAAHRIRAKHGIDGARAMLGHSLASVTERYSREVDRQTAAKIAAEMG